MRLACRLQSYERVAPLASKFGDSLRTVQKKLLAFRRSNRLKGSCMTTNVTPTTAREALSMSRGWLITGGVLSIIVGLMAMSSPLFFSVVIAQFLGAFALVSGAIALFLALFGKEVTHRIAAGLTLLVCVASSIAVITLIFAVFLIVEGIFLIGGAFRLQKHSGWSWTLINGIAALILGIMVYSRWPSDSAWVLGLFFGINLLFNGMSLLMLGLAAPKSRTA
jgi:uncharacterized membrane protein HdeD (DUF308 family)